MGHAPLSEMIEILSLGDFGLLPGTQKGCEKVALKSWEGQCFFGLIGVFRPAIPKVDGAEGTPKIERVFAKTSWEEKHGPGFCSWLLWELSKDNLVVG